MLARQELNELRGARDRPGKGLLNNVVCFAQNRRRNHNANLPSCFEINDELVFPRRFYGQIARFSAFENFIYVYCRASKRLGKARSVANQGSGICMVPGG